MTWSFITMTLLVLFIGAVCAATPWLMPPTECFTVTVPPSAQHDARVVGYKQSYALFVMGITSVCALALLWAFHTQESGNPTQEQLISLTVAISAAVLIPLAAAFALMLRYRGRVQGLKEHEGWTTQAHRSAAIIADDAPKPISLVWYLLYVPLILGMVAFALLAYDRFPNQIPMHTDFYGNADSYADKSIGVVLFPALLTAFMALIFAVTHWGITSSKRPIDPAAPATSALAYGQFARLQSMLMLVEGLVLSAVAALVFYLSALQVISLGTAGAIIGLLAVATVAGVFGISALTGQSGARLAAELRTSDELAADDDEHWVLGTFYWNPQEPSVVVPKRFGIGWTINCAQPSAWAFFGAIMAITIAFSLILVQVAS